MRERNEKTESNDHRRHKAGTDTPVWDHKKGGSLFWTYLCTHRAELWSQAERYFLWRFKAAQARSLSGGGGEPSGRNHWKYHRQILWADAWDEAGCAACFGRYQFCPVRNLCQTFKDPYFPYGSGKPVFWWKSAGRDQPEDCGSHCGYPPALYRTRKKVSDGRGGTEGAYLCYRFSYERGDGSSPQRDWKQSGAEQAGTWGKEVYCSFCSQRGEYWP